MATTRTAGLAKLANGDQMERVVEHPVDSRVESMPFLPPEVDLVEAASLAIL